MMAYAEKLIGLRSEMLAAVGDRSAMRGVLRLGVAETIVHTWLPQLVKSGRSLVGFDWSSIPQDQLQQDHVGA